MPLKRHEQDWEDLADMDTFWAIVGTRRKPGKRDIAKFFLSGDMEIRRVMETVIRLGFPFERELALDFGCGAGRVTRGLAKYFQQCYGVDISETMIALAKELNQSIANCKFVQSTDEHLHLFSDGYFDMIYTDIVLQHMPSRFLIKSYISEFLRILKDGGLLVFQLPSHIPLKHRIQPRRRAYALLRSLGLPRSFLYGQLRLNPVRMNFVPKSHIVDLLNTKGARVLEVKVDSLTSSSIKSSTYFVTK